MATCKIKGCGAEANDKSRRCKRHNPVAPVKQSVIDHQPGSVASGMSLAELRAFKAWLNDRNSEAKQLEYQLTKS